MSAIFVKPDSLYGTNQNHSVMQQGTVKAGDSSFLPTVLRSRGRKNAADLTDQRALGPQPAGLIEKIPHLCSHVSKPRRRPKNHRLLLRKRVHCRDWNVRKRRARPLAPDFSKIASGTSSATCKSDASAPATSLTPASTAS